MCCCFLACYYLIILYVDKDLCNHHFLHHCEDFALKICSSFICSPFFCFQIVSVFVCLRPVILKCMPEKSLIKIIMKWRLVSHYAPCTFRRALICVLWNFCHQLANCHYFKGLLLTLMVPNAISEVFLRFQEDGIDIGSWLLETEIDCARLSM